MINHAMLVDKNKYNEFTRHLAMLCETHPTKTSLVRVRGGSEFAVRVFIDSDGHRTFVNSAHGWNADGSSKQSANLDIIETANY